MLPSERRRGLQNGVDVQMLPNDDMWCNASLNLPRFASPRTDRVDIGDLH